MKKYILFPALCIILVLPIKTLAWGKKGHALVAEVAFNYLDKNTKKIVLGYLDGMSIEDAATWMDDIKDDHSYDYMKPYHYVNIDKGAEVFERSGSNIIYILNQTIKELQNNKNFTKQEIKTKILIVFHLVGDLHQPLHIGYGSDKGGNTVQINYKGQGTNLHSFWDSGIIYDRSITLKDCLEANKFSPAAMNKLQTIDVIAWSKESRSLLDSVYNMRGAKVKDDYVRASAVIIQAQIQKAGIRLAAILNTSFKS
ncbi:S1/P1 nuclease [Flavobacterium sp. HJJ]|uniref:S1/P1 nuclease n=1 Tax=Flavobacterium sp. HJJ TaxID=2783792 RepID=UPI00188DB7CD|nr:S1/P1 nuclease [Flavobacterium sp. HJJ]MBF4473057.1 S1/P1 nuclease [Flavobacterium sp. HJJ]